MYLERTYRRKSDTSRFRYFRSVLAETDLWIGVDPGAWRPEMEAFVLRLTGEIRTSIVGYGLLHPEFLDSHTPLQAFDGAPEAVKRMCSASMKAGVGPMAAVAGTFAAMVGEQLKKEFGLQNLVIENGGDVYVDGTEPISILLDAGESMFTGKTGLELDPGFLPAGVCTSSGMFGHSLSYGKADAVMVACRDASLADAMATASCNRIHTEADIEKEIRKMKKIPELLSCVAVKGNKIGLAGKLPVSLFD